MYALSEFEQVGLVGVFRRRKGTWASASKDEIKKACNAAGGELLGGSESGSYGCENHSNGTMVL